MEETSGLVTVVFPDHHDKLAGGLWNLFRSSHAVDFDLRWGGCSTRAHRLILDVFLSPDKLARCGGQGEGDNHTTDPLTMELGLEEYLPGTNHLDCLMEFLYRGRITVSEESLERLLELAAELDLRVLVDAIEAARNGMNEVVQSDIKRRRRKGIPVKLTNTDGDDLDQSGEDLDDPSYKTKPRAVTKPVAIGVKRGRGRPRGSCKTAVGIKRAVVTKRRKRRDTSESEESHSGSKASEEKAPHVEDADLVKRKRKPVGVVKAEKVAKEKGSARSKAGYKRLWLQRQPLLRCLHCSYETHCKRSYRVHESRHDKTAQVYRCDVCSVAFLNEESLERHKSSQHMTVLATYSCQLCEYSTNKERNLKTHVVTVHRMTPKGVPLAKTFDCSLCDFSSAFASHLANHEMTHKPDRPFQCEQCSYACIRKYDLDKHHKVVHLNQRLFLCVECGHKSASQVQLKSHMRTHTGERPFICLECGKAYKSKDKLKFHVKRHQSDEKPFICDTCGFSAYRRDNLQMHMKRIHKTTLAK